MKKLTEKLNTATKDNALEMYVQEWINEKAEDYDTGIDGVYEDLMRGGCQSGYVGELIYYSDTHIFYDRFYDEIEDLRYELEEQGLALQPKGDLKNWYAWLGFEETARILMDRMEE